MPRPSVPGERTHAPAHDARKTRHFHPPRSAVHRARRSSRLDVVCDRLRLPRRRNVAGGPLRSSLFAIGVAWLFGGACGALGILVSRIRQMKQDLRDLETRLDDAADRNWEMSEDQQRAESFLDAQDDVIVRRDSTETLPTPTTRSAGWPDGRGKNSRIRGLRHGCLSRAKHPARGRHPRLRPKNPK